MPRLRSSVMSASFVRCSAVTEDGFKEVHRSDGAKAESFSEQFHGPCSSVRRRSRVFLRSDVRQVARRIA